MKSAVFAFGLAGLLGGCATNSSDPLPVDTNSAQLGINVTMADGSAPVAGVFQIPRDTHLSASMLGLVNKPGVNDYFFQVVDAGGRLMSTDRLDCRRVTIDTSGNIVAFVSQQVHTGPLSNLSIDPGNPGLPCGHAIAAIPGGSATLALAPFAAAETMVDGNAQYHVMVTPVDGFQGFDELSITQSFMVAAKAVEACSESCQPPVAFCGNGAIEANESCDDGNNACGDGCDLHCQAE